MKISNYVLILSVGLLVACGKPNTPDSLAKPDNSGGFWIISEFLTAGYAQDVLKKDNLVYVATGEGGLQVIDVSDPYNPQTVSLTTDGVKGYSDKIAMVDSIIYLAAGTFGLNVINVADPANPELALSNLGLKPAQNCFILGNFLYTAISEQGVGIADISYPAHPDIRGTVYAPCYSKDVIVTSDTNFMLIASGEMGFSMINISNIVQGYGVFWLSGWCDTPGYAEDLTVLEDQSVAFLACGTAGLQIIDYSDTSNVHIIGSYDGTGYAKELFYKDQKIYMTAELSGLEVVDVSDFTNPVELGVVDTEFALGIEVDDEYVYIADEDQGLVIIKIPD